MGKWQNYNTWWHIDHSSWIILYSGLNVDPIDPRVTTEALNLQRIICSRTGIITNLSTHHENGEDRQNG